MKRWICIALVLISTSAIPHNYVAIDELDSWPTRKEDCLAATIYFESRGEPALGQYLVAEVIMNRVASSKYPDSICEVIKQPAQFSWFEDTIPNIPKSSPQWWKAKEVALKFLSKEPVSTLNLSEGALFYHTIDIKPWWAKKKQKILRLSRHVFYKDKVW